jgi:O-antigen/teichoic acid export membrane protein
VVRRIFRDSAIYAGAGVFSSGVAFILFPLLAHRLRPVQFGIVDIVTLLTTVALLTVALEMSQGLGRMLAGVDDPGERRAYASTALSWSLCCYTVFAGIGLLLAGPLTSVLLGPHVDVWVLRTALGGIWVAGALNVLQTQLQWQLRAKAYATVSVVTAAVATGSTVIYVITLNGGAIGVIGGQMTGAAAGVLVALTFSRGIYGWAFDRAKAHAMLAFSVPLVPSSIGVFLNGYADRLAIQHERSLAEVGVYGVGFRVALAVSLLLLGVQGAVTPLVMARHAEPETPTELARAFRLFWAAGCVAFLVLAVLAEQFVRLLSAPEYFAAAKVVPFLVAAAFLAGLYMFAPGPIIAKRTRIYAVVNVAAGLINLGLAFLLVPSLGIIGAGVATALSSAVMFTATMRASQRLYPVPHNWRRLAGGATATAALVIVARSLIVTTRREAWNAGPLLERMSLCAVGALIVAAVLIDRDEVRAFTSGLEAMRRRRADAWRRP